MEILMKKVKRFWTPSLILGVAILGLVPGCAQASSHTPEPSQTPQPAQMVDSGSWYSRQRWPHDGNPYESQNFIVYSDAASQEARQAVAEVFEEVLAELIAQFGIVKDEMFRFPPGQDKIDIYAYKNRYPQAWGARAYYGGLIVWSLDHNKQDTDLDNYMPIVKHELVHVVDSLLKGRDVANIAPGGGVRVELWFSEGLAEAVTGGAGTQGSAIRDLEHLNYLTAKYGQLSPIAFESDPQVEALYSEEELGSAYVEYHYPMYQLAVEYLLDADGFGKSPRDVTYIFTDIAEGANFSTAFENRMGISLTDYEVQFFDLMDDYLVEESGTFIRIKRMSLTWLALTAGSLIVLAWDLARGTRARWGIRLAWALVTVLFGPLGLLGYLLSYRRPGRQVSHWWRALGASLYSVTGNTLGLMFVIAPLYLFLPAGDAGPMILLAPLLVGWLIFRAPLMAARSGGRYWVAVRRTLLAEFISTILVLIGMLPVLILLPDILLTEWWGGFANDPSSWLFWGVFSLAAIVGAVILYPYNVWMVRRNSAAWPGRATAESESA